MHFSPTNKRISRVFLLFARLCLVWGSPQATVVKRPAPFDGVAGAFAPSLAEVRGKIPQFFVFFFFDHWNDWPSSAIVAADFYTVFHSWLVSPLRLADWHLRNRRSHCENFGTLTFPHSRFIVAYCVRPREQARVFFVRKLFQSGIL